MMDRKSRTSRSASLEETNEELSLWKHICSSLAKLDGIQKETDSALEGINEIRKTVSNDEDLPINTAERLRDLYKQSIDLSANEARTISDIVEKVSVLMALREASENSHEQKRKKRKSEADELKSSTASPSSASSKRAKNDVIPPGTSVAAKQPKQKDKNEEWILAVVISFHADKNKYQVEDVDQDEYGQKQRYFIPPRNVIPVPDGNESQHLPEVPAGQDVLALYPGTTCFYKATVILPPNKNKDLSTAGSYKVQFEDDNNEVKYVMPEHVLEMPKSSK
ncbi:hypothetical protein VTP01DRAFT_2801 [Rhizomucor pusillus]|uniref:uncharacterized protein n=1 Tax=Rhizomucor pusillus TaxID=4840 RepID=UPI0037440EC0